MAIEDYYHRIDIVRPQQVSDGAGGSVTTRPPTGEFFQGVVNDARDSEVFRAAQRGVKVEAKLLAEIGAPIAFGVEILDNGIAYRIVTPPMDVMERGHHLVAMLAVVL